MKYLSLLLLFSVSLKINAIGWKELWQTKDQQAQIKMKEGAFHEAEKLFQNQAWQATAAYRGSHFDNAAQYFESLKTEEGYYNQGNALAHAGRYQRAIEAYNKVLSLNPNHEDAKYNRNLIKIELEKQNQQKKNDQNHESGDTKQNSQQENRRDPKSSDDQSMDSNSKNKNQNGKDNDNNKEHKQENQKENESDKQTESAEKQGDHQNHAGSEDHQEKKNSSDQAPHKNPDNQSEEKALDQQKSSPSQQKNKDNQQSSSRKPHKEKLVEKDEQEKHQAKEQWLRLIPDDPGGLLREKFLRDHHRRNLG